MTKQWRRLDWLSNYEISENGEVRRAVKKHTSPAGRVLKGGINRGYRYYMLVTDNGRSRCISAHRLVCEAFHGPCPPDKSECAHWDGNPSNNHFTNLRWATRKENASDKGRHQEEKMKALVDAILAGPKPWFAEKPLTNIKRHYKNCISTKEG